MDGRISKTSENILAIVMAGECSRVTMEEPGGCGPLRLHSKEFSRQVAPVEMVPFESC